MRRIDALGIGLAIFVGGGVIYFVLDTAGMSGISAGIWTQTLLVAGIVGWSLTYLFRVVTKNMTYNQQLKDYEEAVLQKRLEEMSPEELAKLQEEIEREKQS
ncbi:MAG: DUF3007 family protein [Xenococcaceae cyanobacterium MO_188.B19]|nr:DUF3007 family protein [Xenococcaceae cyanobacterium MO_188.B19]MDJ0682658.1 DUF3007 family protein [Xenococcaceae cyanobacterium MO_167.B52]